MASRDDQLDGARRRLPGIVAQLYGRCAAARLLLENKALRCPTSGEAHAHRLMIEACDLFNRWAIDSGQIPPAGTSSTEGQEHGQAAPQAKTEDGRVGTDLAPGGETRAG